MYCLENGSFDERMVKMTVFHEKTVENCQFVFIEMYKGLTINFS